MSASRDLLVSTAEAVFSGLATMRSASFADQYAPIAEAGFPLLLIPEADGGFGGDWGDLMAALAVAGEHAVAFPIGECIVAQSIVGSDRAGAGGLAEAKGTLLDGHFTGSLVGVPMGNDMDWFVAGLDGAAFVIDRANAANVECGYSAAGDPRDTLHFENSPVKPLAVDAFVLGAAIRVGLAAGAAGRALSLAVDHVNQRVQFGKPLAKFQAVQQSLAVAASECAALTMAAHALGAALDAGEAELEFAAAKLRANKALSEVVAITHQVHGAIGFTVEYPLNHLTRRMMGWRSEFGGDAYWASRLGGWAATQGGRGLWLQLTARSGRR